MWIGIVALSEEGCFLEVFPSPFGTQNDMGGDCEEEEGIL